MTADLAIGIALSLHELTCLDQRSSHRKKTALCDLLISKDNVPGYMNDETFTASNSGLIIFSV
jgi:hypothetical protein